MPTWFMRAVKRFEPVGLRWAKQGRGRFAAVRHVGRLSGRTYETPVQAEASDDGFVVRLPYGTGTDWLRNVRRANGCELETRGRTFRVTAVEVEPGRVATCRLTVAPDPADPAAP